MSNKAGFTMIELIIVIVVIGILASIAIPKFADLEATAKIGATQGSLGALRSALAIQYANSVTTGTTKFPDSVDSTMFADAKEPTNQLTGNTGVIKVTSIPAAKETATAGFWYIQSGASAGRAGAYSDGTVDTSGF